MGNRSAIENGKGFGVSPWGGAPFDCVRKRFGRFYGVNG